MSTSKAKNVEAEIIEDDKEWLPTEAEAKDLAVVEGMTRDDLNEVSSFAEAMNLVKEIYGDYVEAEEFPAADKDELLGRPFLIMHWERRESEDFVNDDGSTSEFIICYCIEPDTDNKFFFTDGGGGIYKRLEQVRQRAIRKGKPGQRGGVMCKRGLRVSEFGLDANNRAMKLGGDGQKGKGKTYYLN